MLTLTSGESSLVVAPEYGAALVGWMVGRTPLLRRALPQASVDGNPHAMGCFPLVPYGNRINQGRFHWLGTDYQLARNFGDHPHSIHGVGWQCRWQVAEASANSVALTLEHRPNPAWPFAFQASVRYSLSAGALAVAIEVTSRHHAPVPAGIGLHPYFPKANDPTLCFDASGAWENGADQLPLHHGAPPAGWRHTEARPVVASASTTALPAGTAPPPLPPARPACASRPPRCSITCRSLHHPGRTSFASSRSATFRMR